MGTFRSSTSSSLLPLPSSSSRRDRSPLSPLRARAPLRGAGTLGLTVALLAGCGGDDADEPATITLRTERTPLLLAFHEHEGAWQTLPAEGDASFEIEVSGAYEVVVVCSSTGQARIQAFRHARVPADGAVLDELCAQSDPGLTVQGTMAQPGVASLGGLSQGGTFAGWPFGFRVEAGVHDLVLFSRTSDLLDGIAIRRGLEVSEPRDLGSIDLAQEGLQPTVVTEFTATNLLPDDRKAAWLLLTLGGRPHTISGGASRAEPWRVPLAPAALLQPGERQVVALTTERPEVNGASRTRYVDAGGGATAVTLPAYLDGATFEGDREPTVLLPGLGEYDQLRLARNSWDFVTPTGTYYELLLSGGFAAATGAQRLELQFRDVPGFLESWYDSGPGGFQQRMGLSAGTGTPGEPGSSVSTVGTRRFTPPSAK